MISLINSAGKSWIFVLASLLSIGWSMLKGSIAILLNPWTISNTSNKKALLTPRITAHDMSKSTNPTTINDLPTEVLLQVTPHIGNLPYESYKAIRSIDPSFFDPRHLILSNISPLEDLQYFKPIQANESRGSYMFHSYRALQLRLDAHLRAHGLKASELSVFIEYKEPIPYYDWFLGKYETDQNSLRTANLVSIESLNPATDVHSMIQYLTARGFNKVEVFLRSLFSVHNFKKAIQSPISFIFDERSVQVGSYPFLMDQAYNTVIYQDWNGVTLHINPDLYVFDNASRSLVPLSEYRQIRETRELDTLSRLKDENSTIDHFQITQLYSLLASDDTCFRLSTLAFDQLKTFEWSSELNKTTELTILNCKFPMLSKLSLKGLPNLVAIQGNSFPSLKSVELSSSIKIFKDNTFPSDSIDDLTVTVWPKTDNEDSPDMRTLISLTKSLRISGHHISKPEIEEISHILESSIRLTRLVLGELDAYSLLPLVQTPLSQVKQLVVYSCSNTVVHETNRETISSNYSKLLSILQNPTSEYLWNHSDEPHPNFKSLEEIYVFNSGINLLTKSCSTLKRVFV
ncbi:hypothetical protein WICPIJ_004421, partial [Wickerhamomyces pijperi]